MLSRLLLALALALAGCATFTDAELAQIRQRGLRPEVLSKLEHRGFLDTDDLIELRRTGVPDEQVVRHLENAGVNYVATRSDAARLRKARVSQRVIDSFLNASERFAMRAGFQQDDDGWFFADPWYPYFYGSWQVGYGSFGHDGHHGHGGHHRR